MNRKKILDFRSQQVIRMGTVLTLCLLVFCLDVFIDKNKRYTFASELEPLNWDDASDRCSQKLSGALIPIGYVKEHENLEKQLFENQNYIAWVDGQLFELGCTSDKCYAAVKNKTKSSTKLPFICGTKIHEDKILTHGEAKSICSSTETVLAEELIQTIESRASPLTSDYWLFNINHGDRTKCASVDSTTVKIHYKPCSEKHWAVCIHLSFLTSYQDSVILTASEEEPVTRLPSIASSNTPTDVKTTYEYTTISSSEGTTVEVATSGMLYWPGLLSTKNKDGILVTSDFIGTTENVSATEFFAKLPINITAGFISSHENAFFLVSCASILAFLLVLIVVTLLWKRSSKVLKAVTQQFTAVTRGQSYSRFYNMRYADLKASGKASIIMTNEGNPYSQLYDDGESTRAVDGNMLTKLIDEKGYMMMKDVRRDRSYE